MGLCAVLISCQTQGSSSSKNAEGLPPMSAVRSRLNQPSEGRSNSTYTVVEVTRLDLPLEGVLDNAWLHVDAGRLDPSVVEMWRINGLKIASLPRSKWKPFVESLPEAINAHVERFLGSGQLSPILASPPLTDVLEVELGDPGHASRPLLATRGRCQLLMRVIEVVADVAVVELVVHHHLPRSSIEPRAAVEKTLEGKIFREMTLHAKIPRNALLIIAPDLPPNVDSIAKLDSDDQSSIDTNDTQEDASQTVQPSLDENPTTQPTADSLKPENDPSGKPSQLPNNFGRWLLTASRAGQPIQMIAVIAVGDVPSGP